MFSRESVEVAFLKREIEILKQSHATEIESWKKIVSVLERLVPLLPAPRVSLTETAATASEREQGPGSEQEHQQFHVAESGEEYELRISNETALAHSLGVAPWSPAFQEAINQMRRDILRPRIEKDEEGNEVHAKPYTEEEADDLVREAFRLAQSAATIRE